MRIGGIASGMDTEQMVKDLMRAERVRVDKYYRQEEAIKWQQEALNTTNKTLAEFILKARSDFGLTTTTSTGSVLNRTSQSFDWVKKVSSSNESAVTATATASAMEGTHKIEVVNLAEVASVTSKQVSGFEGTEQQNNLVDKDGNFIFENLGIKDGITFKVLNINGEKFTIGEGKIETISQLVNDINNAKVTLEDGTKSEKSLGLRAAYDKDLGKLMINTKEQGASQEIEISGDLTDRLFRNPEGTENPIDPENPNKVFTAKGKDAKINFNGDEITKPSNNFSIFGVNYQLQSAKHGDVITVNVESNVDGIMDKVKSFVDDYNALIDDLNGKLKEKSYRDFQPLTKEEREAMSDKEIELWEEKAKSGLLRNDETLTKVLQTMRSGLYDGVEGVGGFKHLTELGISTGNYQSGGKLEINEEKLRKAIIDNPDGVVDMLFKKPGSEIEGDEAKRANTGLVERLFNDMIGGMKEVVRRSGTGADASLFRNVQSNMLIDFVTSGSISVMDRDIMNIGTRISNEERLLLGREDRYWRQFTAMEKAMERMNQQSGWLMSQLGQMG